MSDRLRKSKKKKLNIKRLIIAIFILLILGISLFELIKYPKNNIITKTYYISSTTNVVKLYKYNEEENKMTEDTDIYRGTKIKSQDKEKIVDDIKYIEITYNDQKYFIAKDNLTKDKDDVVKETEKYVRTSVTVYQNNEDYKIESFIKKGNKLEILDYDKIDNQGLVNM